MEVAQKLFAYRIGYRQTAGIIADDILREKPLALLRHFKESIQHLILAAILDRNSLYPFDSLQIAGCRLQFAICRTL